MASCVVAQASTPRRRARTATRRRCRRRRSSRFAARSPGRDIPAPAGPPAACAKSRDPHERLEEPVQHPHPRRAGVEEVVPPAADEGTATRLRRRCLERPQRPAGDLQVDGVAEQPRAARERLDARCPARSRSPDGARPPPNASRGAPRRGSPRRPGEAGGAVEQDAQLLAAPEATTARSPSRTSRATGSPAPAPDTTARRSGRRGTSRAAGRRSRRSGAAPRSRSTTRRCARAAGTRPACARAAGPGASRAPRPRPSRRAARCSRPAGSRRRRPRACVYDRLVAGGLFGRSVPAATAASTVPLTVGAVGAPPRGRRSRAARGSPRRAGRTCIGHGHGARWCGRHVRSAPMDLVLETVALRGGELEILRPRDSEALLDEHAFEEEELLPYWAELWPSGVGAGARARRQAPLRRRARARARLRRSGLPSIVAAAAGARVLATDWSRGRARARSPATRSATASRSRSQRADWDAPGRAARARRRSPLVLAADVLYERRNVAGAARPAPAARRAGGRDLARRSGPRDGGRLPRARRRGGLAAPLDARPRAGRASHVHRPHAVTDSLQPHLLHCRLAEPELRDLARDGHRKLVSHPRT